jgi:hypothetical protein
MEVTFTKKRDEPVGLVDSLAYRPTVVKLLFFHSPGLKPSPFRRTALAL